MLINCIGYKHKLVTMAGNLKGETKGDVVKRSDRMLVYGSTTKGDVVKRSDCTHYSVWEHYQGWCCKEV